MLRNLFVLVIIFCLLLSCEEGNDIITRTTSEQLQYDIKRIKGYIQENQLIGFSETSSGLHYKLVDNGSGVFPKIGDTLSVDYYGQYLNGSEFDKSNTDEPFEFILGVGIVIEGWEEGIPFIDEEGSGILIVPSALGYGKNPPSSIPPNSILIFSVDLVDIK